MFVFTKYLCLLWPPEVLDYKMEEKCSQRTQSFLKWKSLLPRAYFINLWEDWQISNHKYTVSCFRNENFSNQNCLLKKPSLYKSNWNAIWRTGMEFNCKFCLYLINKTPCFIVLKWSSLYSVKVLILPIIIYPGPIFMSRNSPRHGEV